MRLEDIDLDRYNAFDEIKIWGLLPLKAMIRAADENSLDPEDRGALLIEAVERAEGLATFFDLVTANYVVEFKKRPSPDATG